MDERLNFDHYIAQHYIKLFTDEVGTGYVGDVLSHQLTSTSDFTRLMGRENWSVDQQVENAFSKIEDKVASALKTARSNPGSISGLAVPTYTALRSFICMHYARSPGVHDTMNQSTRQLESELRRVAPPQADISKLGLRDATRPETLHMGLEVANSINIVLLMKGCVAVQAPNGQQFLLGDNPLVNLTSQKEWYVKGGLPNHNTYLWFPLTPAVGLFFCHGLGNVLGQGRLKQAIASSKFVNVVNRAEVYLATQHIIGASRGLIRGKLRLPNVGEKRSEVVALDWAPFVFNQNKAFFQVKEDLIDQIRQRAK